MDVDMEPEPTVVLAQTSEDQVPMEVISTVPDATDDPLKGEYTWIVEDIKTLEDKSYSEIFELGGYSWQLLCFPRGNNKRDQMALYLAVPDTEDQGLGWQRNVAFKLTIVDQIRPEQSLVKEANHNFSQEGIDWGFTSFCTVSELHDPTKGLCVEGRVVFKVSVAVNSPDEHGVSYDTREKTGFVGLSNQGATCYMNSLLQTLYNINAFRKAVYHMPTSEDEEPSASMALALQSVFYKLQFGNIAVSTKNLTASFGWDSVDAFQQHDVQELNRILCDRLEEKMKGTRVEGTVNRLFEGHTLNYIDCINIDFKSSRKEPFQDLQLDVKGCPTIYDSFKKYCEVETLDGDNKYEAEGHGKQDARKGVLFDSLPPVLNLHLKRFEYDYHKDAMVKINDKYEFYDELDLDQPPNAAPDGASHPLLTTAADRSVRNKYKLLAVLVHSGGVHGGHYYAYIRPDGTKWLKFDDDAVEIVSETRAVQENWGGDDEKPPLSGYGTGLRLSRFSNAYMLVYVRESEWDSVMCSVTEEDISEHVRARLKAEQAEKQRIQKEKAEAHLFTLVRVATDADIKAQVGVSRFFDLVDFQKVELQLKMPKKATFSEVHAKVEQALGVAPTHQRYWRWINRLNLTHRVSESLPRSSGELTVEAVHSGAKGGRSAPKHGEMSKFDLFLETPPAKPGAELPVLSKSTALIFLKHYLPGDARTPARLEYAGRVVANLGLPLADLLPLLRGRAGLQADIPVQVFEEVKFEPSVMVEGQDPSSLLRDLKIEDGDILAVQQALTDEERAAVEFPLLGDFLRHVRNLISVTFRRVEGQSVVDDDEDAVRLELGKDMSWDEVSGALAARLGLDHPLKLRFTLQSSYTATPRPHPLRYSSQCTLEDMLRGWMQHAPVTALPTVYYEVIDMPLPDFERVVTYRVAFHNAKHEESTAMTVRLLKDRTVAELLEEVRRQLPAEAHGGAPLRLMEVYQWRIWSLFDPKLSVEKMCATSSPWHLRAEVVPADQRDLEQEGRLHIQCLQVDDKDDNPKMASAFSDPFVMALGPTETVGEVKARVQREMGVPDDEFSAWKVMLVSGMASAQEELADDVVVAQRLSTDDLGPSKLYCHTDRPMLGFHHENKNPRRTHAHLNRSSAVTATERALKIKA